MLGEGDLKLAAEDAHHCEEPYHALRRWGRGMVWGNGRFGRLPRSHRRLAKGTAVMDTTEVRTAVVGIPTLLRKAGQRCKLTGGCLERSSWLSRASAGRIQ